MVNTAVEAPSVPSVVQIRQEAIPGMPRVQYVPAIAKAREQFGLLARQHFQPVADLQYPG
jgi:hypothetical protein